MPIEAESTLMRHGVVKVRRVCSKFDDGFIDGYLGIWRLLGSSVSGSVIP